MNLQTCGTGLRMRCHRRYGPERVATASLPSFSANVFAHAGAAAVEWNIKTVQGNHLFPLP